MPKKITIQINDDISASDALQLLANWYARNASDPQTTPMTGILSSSTMHVYKREYRKNDCFVVWPREKEGS